MAIENEVLYVRAASALRVIEINEPLSAEDRLPFALNYPTVYAMLEGRGLAQWDEEGPIPDRYWMPVRDLLAEVTAPEFGKTAPAVGALPELERQVAPDYVHDVTSFQDF